MTGHTSNSRLLFPALLLAWIAGSMLGPRPAEAAPRTPATENVVLERLPVRAGDATGRELRRLREDLRANPRDAVAAERLARRYFELASGEGDPRYIGYAEAVLRPWAGASDAPPEIVLVGALLKQYRHEFTAAMQDLDRVLLARPGHTEAISWQMALHLVRADYAGARQSCTRLAATATVLATTACTAVIDGINGKARSAHAALAAALAAHPPRNEEYRQWVLTRLAEMAQRFNDRALAERHFREALSVPLVDGFVLAAYADFLLDERRPAEVLPLLRGHENSDILLLRLALAAQALKSPDAPRHIRALGDRFAASALRGDRLHLQEQARFELQLLGNAASALQLIVDDWAIQREPRDARFFMEAALAAGKPAAARPALEWMEATGYEDPHYQALAARLRKALP